MEEENTLLSDPMNIDGVGFHGNPELKPARTSGSLDIEHIKELAKCAKDPIYFAEKYVKIVNVDTGLQTIKLYPYQKKILKAFKEHRYNILLSCRQSGKCVSGDTYITIRNEKYNDGKEFKIKLIDFYIWLSIRREFKHIDSYFEHHNDI